MEETGKAFGRLVSIMDELRVKCPWDKKQTFESLRNLTIEETYELADAILNEDKEEIKKELGDILLHIVFYARIGSEDKSFTIKDVIDGICEKLIFRHPHVFGDVDVKNDPEIVKENWEELKQKEGLTAGKAGLSADKARYRAVLGGVPNSLPALIKANRIQEKARAVGFDWEEKKQIWDKVREELKEVEQEVERENMEKLEKEIGDLIFSIVNAARLYEIDPETALEKTNMKFIKRFNYLEEQAIKKGKSLKKMTLDEMDKIWEEAKKYD